jgi:hypothetical protein
MSASGDAACCARCKHWVKVKNRKHPAMDRAKCSGDFATLSAASIESAGV